jgi:hypothetical protein
LNPTPTKREDIKYNFDFSKCDRVFDTLVQGKIIRVRDGHVIPPPEELAGRSYCKWHNCFSHSTNDCNVFRRQIQSAIDDGRLIFTKCSKTKLDINPFPISAIDFENQKILVRSDQTESTKEKNIIIDDNAAPRMIKPKNPNVGVQNVDERKRKQAPRPKPTVKHMLDKYTSRKANTVFSRLGGTKHPRSPTRPRGHECWRVNSQNQQPYFPVVPIHWGCPPPMCPKVPPWDYNSPYHTWPACYLQPEWVPSRYMFRPKLHEKKVRFHQKAMSRDATIIRGNRSLVHKEDVRNCKGNRKLMWMPVNRVEPKCVKSPDDLDATHGLKVGDHRSAVGVVNNHKTADIDRVCSGSVKGKVASTEGKHANDMLASFSTRISRKSGSARRYAVSACLSPTVLKSDASTYTQRWDSRNGGSQRVVASDISDQQRMFSAEDKLFAPKMISHQYRPRNSGGNRIKSVVAGTKPRPQWCPTGRTHTQKLQVQRLQVLEIREKSPENWHNEWFNQDKPMVPTKRISRGSTSLHI